MKNIKPVIFIAIFLLAVFLFSTLWNFDNSNAFDTIATFLSITIGFTITTLSIIATSSFSKELYKVEDENDNSKTLLHVLMRSFKTSTFIFTTTIGLILIYKFISSTKIVDSTFFIISYPITFLILLKSIIWSFTVTSFYFFIRLFETFAKFVVKTAMRQ